MSDPVTILGALQTLTASLDTASRELYKLQVQFDEISQDYDDAFNDLLVSLLDEYEDNGKRLPGEDVRNALVIKKLRKEKPILYGQYRRTKAELDRGERRCKRVEKAISSYQSQLSFLKTEAQATAA